MGCKPGGSSGLDEVLNLLSAYETTPFASPPQMSVQPTSSRFYPIQQKLHALAMRAYVAENTILVQAASGGASKKVRPGVANQPDRTTIHVSEPWPSNEVSCEHFSIRKYGTYVRLEMQLPEILRLTPMLYFLRYRPLLFFDYRYIEVLIRLKS
jgi:hypothetical protein